MIKAGIYFVLTAIILLAVFVFVLGGELGMVIMIGTTYLLLINLASFIYINNAFDKRPAIIIRRFMTSMTLKLIVSVGLLVWFMMGSAEKDKASAIFLLVLYFVLLMLNSAMAMQQVKSKWGNGEQ